MNTKTLKRMLQCVVDEDGRNWDLLLPNILFMVCESPQLSTSIKQFELLSARRLKGLLDVVKEAWEEQTSAF